MKNRLKQLRKSERLSQADLAKAFHLSKSAICHYENGTRNIPNQLLIDFAEYFDASVDYLLGRNRPKRY